MKYLLTIVILLMITGCSTYQKCSEDVYSNKIWIPAGEDVDMIILGDTGSDAVSSSLINSYWRLNGIAEANEEDRVGSYPLNEVNGVSAESGNIFGNARGNFTGGGGALRCFNTGLGNNYRYETFFIDGWFKTSASGTVQAVFSNNGWLTIYDYWRLVISASGTLRFDPDPNNHSNSLESVGTYTDGEWHYFFIAIKGAAGTGADMQRMYVDGEQVDSQDGYSTGVSGSLYGYLIGDAPDDSSDLFPLDGYVTSFSYGRITTQTWDTLEQLQLRRYNGGVGAEYLW